MHRQRTVISLFSLIFILLFISCSAERTAGKPEIFKAKVTLVVADVYLLRQNQPQKIKVKLNDMIQPQDIIITGKDSEANVVIPERGIVRINENSYVAFSKLLKAGEKRNYVELRIKAGKILLGLEKLKKDSSFRIETPTAVAGVRGTSFLMSVTKSDDHAFPYFVKVKEVKNGYTQVAVLSGEVEVTDLKNKNNSKTISSLKEGILLEHDLSKIVINNITKNEVREIAALKDPAEMQEFNFDTVVAEIKKYIQKYRDEILPDEKKIIKEMELKGEIKPQNTSDKKYLEDDSQW